MRFTLQQFLIGANIIIVSILLFAWYKTFSELHAVKQEIQGQQVASTLSKKDFSDEDDIIQAATEHGFNKRQLWSALQKKLKDTVVQVFSQIAEFNWVEPYKTPSQSEATGTAFFISPQGEMVTNAHVVDQAKVVFIQIPSLGKRRFEVDVIGVSPERDLALMKLKPQDVTTIKKELNKDVIPSLKLGDSDTIDRADKIMALGYPLGQQGLKSTTGVVSGREHISGQHFIQISAPLNKGNSGGPSLDWKGEVIGVNSAIIQNAQNVGYIVPINEVKLFLEQINSVPDQEGTKLLRKPFLGVLFNNANDNLTRYLGNPPPGGLYVVEIYEGSPLHKAGIRAGDMIYKINNNGVDIYGEMNVPWSKEDKVSIIDYVSRLKIGQDVNIDFYRKGALKQANFKFTQSERPPIRRVYPGYEKIDYEMIGGIVIMPLTLNHILLLAQFAPELVQYADLKKHLEPALLITHVLLNSPASRARCIGAGTIVSEVNGEKVKTLDEFRKALKAHMKSGYLTIKTTENIFLVLPLKEILENERRLSATYFYPLSETYMDLEKSLMPKNKVETKETNIVQ